MGTTTHRRRSDSGQPPESLDGEVGAGNARSVRAWRGAGLCGIAAGVVVVILGGLLSDWTMALAARFLSVDGVITQARYARQIVLVSGALSIAAGAASILFARKAAGTIRGLVFAYRVWTGPRFTIQLALMTSLVGATLCVMRLCMRSLGLRGLYGEDRALESLTAVLFIAAAVLMFSAASRLRKRHAPRRSLLIWTMVGIGTVFFFFGMEEVSWGQRLLGWETPALLERLNDQGEFNLHNIKSPLLEPIYQWGMLAFTLSTVFGWVLLARTRAAWLAYVVPHLGLAGLLVLMLLFGTYVPRSELLEQLGAVFASSYAWCMRRVST